MERANIYIDGFNLYYGCIRGRNPAYRWADLHAFCQNALPEFEIHRIRYFTALVNDTPDDPDKQQRQLTYLRALETVPNLTIHRGRFAMNKKWRRPVIPPLGNPSTLVQVWQEEEKGSDVNLASHLLMDGFDHDYEIGIVVSNDSDLLEPINLVRSRLGLRVGILNPRKKTARDLIGCADFSRQVRQWMLREALFPDQLQDSVGTITKPATW